MGCLGLGCLASGCPDPKESGCLSPKELGCLEPGCRSPEGRGYPKTTGLGGPQG